MSTATDNAGPARRFTGEPVLVNRYWIQGKSGTSADASDRTADVSVRTPVYLIHVHYAQEPIAIKAYVPPKGAAGTRQGPA